MMCKKCQYVIHDEEILAIVNAAQLGASRGALPQPPDGTSEWVLKENWIVSPLSWWACECGYSMPEPLKQCVKCGAKRPQESE